MEKRAEAFRSIGEVASLIGVAPHALRYWESQFSLLKPMKRPDGRRYYRPEDVQLVAGLYEILREEGLTIRGAKKLLASDRGAAVRARGAARLGLAGPDQQSKGLLASGAGEPEPSVAGQPAGTETAPDKSRPASRKRVQAAPLPLFPDLEPSGPDADLMQKLVSLTTRLRETGFLSAPARRQAVSLQQAIAGQG